MQLWQQKNDSVIISNVIWEVVLLFQQKTPFVIYTSGLSWYSYTNKAFVTDKAKESAKSRS